MSVNRQTMKTRVESHLALRLGPGERVVDVVPAWAAQAPTGIATLLSRRRIHAVAVTTDRLAVYDIAGRSKQLDAVLDRAFDKLTLVKRGSLTPMSRVAILDLQTPWLLEFRPRDRAIARTLADALAAGTGPDAVPDDRAGTDTTDAESTAATEGAGEIAWSAPAAAVPGPPPGSPPASAVLAVLAMGDPTAVALLAQVSAGGFPPPPDPLPVVDRISIRNVAASLRNRQASATEAQRWAAVVQRAVRSANPPLALDPNDPFTDQLLGALSVILALGPTTDPDAAADDIEAVLEGRRS